MAGLLQVATCQFAISSEIEENAKKVKRFMRQAAKRGADLIHFPETALSGYGGAEITTWVDYEKELLAAQLKGIRSLAKELKIWVILGSSHFFDEKRKPYNCLYAIAPSGRIRARYDKHFCTDGDLKFYTPGEDFPVFVINGVRCACLICYDVRFPELYRAYKKRRVQMMFHSFHNARTKKDNIHTVIMRASLQAHAASNYMWISASNCATPHQSWPSVQVQPDGKILRTMKQNREGFILQQIDFGRAYYDAAGSNRDLAMAGVLNNASQS